MRTVINILLFITIMFTLWLSLSEVSWGYTDEQIVNAIFKAEGGLKAKYLYGIRSVPYKNIEEARKICFNTVRNNRKRYSEYGYKQYASFIDFLASRYCPINASNDPKGLNKNWIKNVRYFLNHE